MVKQDNKSVMDFYMKVKASIEKQIREMFVNGLSPENYLEAEKFESDISLQLELLMKHNGLGWVHIIVEQGST